MYTNRMGKLNRTFAYPLAFVSVYHRYAIFLRPISPSTEISELQAGINYYCIIVANRAVIGNA